MVPSPGFLKRWKSQDKERAQFSLSLLTPFIKDVHREKSLCSCSSFVSSNICQKQCFTEKEKKRMSPGDERSKALGHLCHQPARCPRQVRPSPELQSLTSK